MDYIHEPQPNDGTVRPLPRRLGPSVPDGVLAGTRESVPSLWRVLGGDKAGCDVGDRLWREPLLAPRHRRRAVTSLVGGHLARAALETPVAKHESKMIKKKEAEKLIEGDIPKFSNVRRKSPMPTPAAHNAISPCLRNVPQHIISRHPRIAQTQARARTYTPTHGGTHPHTPAHTHTRRHTPRWICCLHGSVRTTTAMLTRRSKVPWWPYSYGLYSYGLYPILYTT